MSIVLDGTSGITSPTYGGTVASEYSVPVTSFKNRIINGGMVIDQRNAGASVTLTTNGTYTLDRWICGLTQSSKFSVQQNAGAITPPVGFINYLGVTSLSAYSVVAGDIFFVSHRIEGSNISDLAWGTANAATVTLSFWVRSSLTGTFGGALQNSGASRAYPFTFTINAANTWESKTITIAGDISGTWLTTNGQGINVNFGLGVGSTYSATSGAWAAGNYSSATGAVSVVGTSGATFYITGVQLEKGSVATSFDYRPYGTELSLCQRYYTFENGSLGGNSVFSGNVTSGGAYYASTMFKQSMRAAPTIVLTNSTNLSFPATVGATYPTLSGFVENRTANATGAGYFFSTWAASAEL